jgi:hypothetical protein
VKRSDGGAHHAIVLLAHATGILWVIASPGHIASPRQELRGCPQGAAQLLSRAMSQSKLIAARIIGPVA